MESTKIALDTQKLLENVLCAYPLVLSIVQKVNAHNGRALLVGGAVRDLLLKITPKDLDIEVHSISLALLESILRQFGTVSLVGKSFGVLRVHGLDIDWSLPRKDSAGRKPQVIIDSGMAFEDAFARRDLTINAMGIDLITYELIDPFNGLQDLHNKILRAPNSERFIEDPLRFYRVMQFIGRFEMMPESELQRLCQDMDISAVSQERVEAEFEKLVLKSRHPSHGIRWLKDIGRLQEVLPELYATIGVPQSPDWHPEGDVFEHSMQALDAAADIGHNKKFVGNSQKKLVLLYAALCHDLGKVTTTKKIEGVWRSLGHEAESARLAELMLPRITGKKELIVQVVLLAKYHMMPMQLVANRAKPGAYKRLAHKLAPHVTLHMLAELCLADKRGRNGSGHEPLRSNFEDVEIFIQKSADARVSYQPEKPVLLGRDLLDVIPSGPRLGELLKRAYDIQLEEGIVDVQELKKRALALYYTD